jgi:hypothetical protein
MNLQDIRQNLCYSETQTENLKLSTQAWLCGLSSQYPIALTLTLKQTIAYTTPKGTVRRKINRQDCEQIAQRFIQKLNQQVFGHSAKRHGKHLKYLVVVEDEHSKKNLHLHMAIGDIPNHVKLNQIDQLVTKAKLHVENIDEQHKVDLADSGWMTYITKECGKHDTDNVLWQLA